MAHILPLNRYSLLSTSLRRVKHRENSIKPLINDKLSFVQEKKKIILSTRKIKKLVIFSLQVISLTFFFVVRVEKREEGEREKRFILRPDMEFLFNVFFSDDEDLV